MDRAEELMQTLENLASAPEFEFKDSEIGETAVAMAALGRGNGVIAHRATMVRSFMVATNASGMYRAAQLPKNASGVAAALEDAQYVDYLTRSAAIYRAAAELIDIHLNEAKAKEAAIQ